MTIYRFKGQTFDAVAVEIEYRGNDHWWVAGDGFTSEHRAWDIYEGAVVREGKDPVGGEGKLFPTAYFIDKDCRLPVTKSWLQDQVNAQLVIS